MTKNVFCEVTVHPWIQVDIYSKFEEMPLRGSWDIAITRMGRTYRQPENIRQRRGIKINIENNQ